HASNFRPVKRVGDVVRIFEKVRSSIPSKLILIGDGPERLFVQQLVKDLKLTGDVHFLGEQDYIEPLFFCADLFLLPSEQESFGLTALEAMACGVPVIGTEIGGLPEVISHGETGYLFPIGDTSNMAKEAVKLLNNTETHELFRRQSRKRATQYFNADKIITQYEEFYKEILEFE
ncbi:MAG: glycosyltransferase, partial [Nitrospinota bacterium]